MQAQCANAVAMGPESTGRVRLDLMQNGGAEEDKDVRAALAWLADCSGDSNAFWTRTRRARETYRHAVSLQENLGQDLVLDRLGVDLVASYFGQADALLHDRRAYDLVLGAQILPFVKQLGLGVEHLKTIPGAAERASRLLQWRSRSTDPGSALFELVVAARYAQEGFRVQFIPEAPGNKRTPDFAVERPGFRADVECKRLQRGAYEKEEIGYQRAIFREFARVVDENSLSLHVDVTYTQELKDIPPTYLYDRLKAAQAARIATLGGFPWKDEYGSGLIRPANIEAVRADTRASYLLFGPKLARLLCGRQVAPGNYNMTASGAKYPGDVRYLDQLFYGSVVTWQCVASRSIEARARHVRSKLNEVDEQLRGSIAGIAHIAMDAERDTRAADLRRVRNIEEVGGFAFASPVCAAYLNYFVSRVTEVSSWTIDETVDRFGPLDPTAIWSGRIFGEAEVLGNDLPAWHQRPPAPPRIC